jgi:monofunctional biosynthetic peptidoglycan transglycosylase
MIRHILIAAAILLLIFALYQWFTFPDVSQLAEERPKTTSFMERRKQALKRAGKNDQIDYRWVSYSSISPYLRRAVLVSEDNAFYEHEGVDVEGLKEALRRDWQAKRFTRGGSTITQQLAKNLYLSPSRNPWRKLKEFLIARQLESELSKKRILELYLNVVELGERVYGAEAAARHYFGKPASALSPSEAALLAGALPNPRAMNPGSPNRRLRARQRIILSRMRRWGQVAEEQVLTATKPQPGPAVEPEPAVEPQPVSEPPIIDTTVPDEPAVETTTTDTAPPTETAAPPTETQTDPQTPPTTTVSSRAQRGIRPNCHAERSEASGRGYGA